MQRPANESEPRNPRSSDQKEEETPDPGVNLPSPVEHPSGPMGEPGSAEEGSDGASPEDDGSPGGPAEDNDPVHEED
jgi:hypothetical protein